jgi:hypothetical protein
MSVLSQPLSRVAVSITVEIWAKIIENRTFRHISKFENGASRWDTYGSLN